MLGEIEKMKTYNEIKENIRIALCGKNEIEDIILSLHQSIFPLNMIEHA